MMHLEFAGTRHPIGAGEAVIGSDAECTVVLGGAGVRPRHAVLYGSPAGAAIRPVGPEAGVLLNGRLLGDDLRPLVHGDRIQIGAHELFAVDTGRAGHPGLPAGAGYRLSDTLHGMPAVVGPQVATAAYASLLIRTGPAKGQRLDIHAPAVRIGRGMTNDVVIADPSVSSTHATLGWREGLWMLTDAGSTNGTYLDGEPVTEETPVMPGASVRIGDVTLLFEPHTEPPASVSAAAPVPEPRSTPSSVRPAADLERGTPGWMIAIVVMAALSGIAAGFVLLR